MFGLAARLLGSAIAPLTDRIAEVSARLLRKLAFLLVAGVCLTVVLIALTLAFALWIASQAGPIIAALAVAGVYLLAAVTAVVFALRDGSRKDVAAAGSEAQAAGEAEAAKAGMGDHIDRFVAPLIALLQQLGLSREKFAVLAGASVAKQLGPIPLVSLAVIAGFLIGRMWKRWRNFLSLEVLASILGPGLFGFGRGRASSEAAETE